MKKIFLLLTLLCTALTLYAGPIGEQRAREIAQEFLSRHTTRAISAELELEWAGSDVDNNSSTGDALDSSLLYIYNYGDNNGFVVVAGDSNINPIIAYSFESTLDMNNLPEATAAILDAWCRQVEDARQSAKPISGTTMPTATRTNDELLYETALWDQTEPYNLETPIIDGKNTYTGCGATAMAILCHYHRWPECGVGTTPAYSYTMYDTTYYVDANELGRKYDYDNMLTRYDEGYTEEQGYAVAALMKDIGTAIRMYYHTYGSGADSAVTIAAFTKYFGYSKKMEFAYNNGYSDKEWAELVRTNLREYGPTLFCGTGDAGGHGFVVDGFKADDYFHFNFGWSGDGNGYYLIPNIEFYLNQQIIVNFEPDRDGTTEYCDSLFLYTEKECGGIFSHNTGEYATGTPFECNISGIVNLGVEDFVGDISLVLCDKDGNIKESLYTLNTTVHPRTALFIEETIEVVITKTIECGDNLRVYYKGELSNEWKWARNYFYGTIIDKVLLTATPEQIAEGMTFEYDKSANRLSITNKHATKMSVYDNETNELLDEDGYKANETRTYSNLESGTYRFEASLGEEPYAFIVKL